MHREVLMQMKTANDGKTLSELADHQPVLLVFLRHFGCSFCREAMSELSQKRRKLDEKNVRLVFVHMAPSVETAEKFFHRFKLMPVDHVQDPGCYFYQQFGLIKAKGRQLISLMNWIRGFESSIIHANGFAAPSTELGDGFQMPGVFLIFRNKIHEQFVHINPYDRPDYEDIIRKCPL